MKTHPTIKIIILSIALLLPCLGQSQTSSILRSTSLVPIAGKSVKYSYVPAKNIRLPTELCAIAVFEHNGNYYERKIKLLKIKTTFEFTFKAPDSISILVFAIADSKSNFSAYNFFSTPPLSIVDNNGGKGFIVYLHNKKGKKFIFQETSLTWLLNDFATYFLSLNRLPKKTILKLYQNSFRKFPELMRTDKYIDFQIEKYYYNPQKEKANLFALQMQLNNFQSDEKALLTRKRIFKVLNMTDKEYSVDSLILKLFPYGLLAREKYLINYARAVNYDLFSEVSIYKDMLAYQIRFKDYSEKSSLYFLNKKLNLLVYKKNWSALIALAESSTDQLYSAVTLNYNAWNLSGKLLNNAANDIDAAALLSQKSLQILQELMMQNQSVEGYQLDAEGQYNFSLNTYALILYKQKKFDSAFYYQNLLYSKGFKMLSAEALENYVVFAEKSKGDSFARAILESELLAGNGTETLIKQLENIYLNMGIEKNYIKKLKVKNYLLKKQRNAQNILFKYSTSKAPDFTLLNMNGKKVSLNYLKGKIVVIDFWASWCMPCRESFPDMQELLNQYESDTSIVFLFIDTWERLKGDNVKDVIKKIINDGGFSFNVLFDPNNITCDAYKVEALPQKFVIGKEGELVYFGFASKEIKQAIEIEILRL